MSLTWWGCSLYALLPLHRLTPLHTPPSASVPSSTQQSNVTFSLLSVTWMFTQPGYILWQVICRNSLVELWLGSRVASVLHAGHCVDLGGGSFKSLDPVA